MATAARPPRRRGLLARAFRLLLKLVLAFLLLSIGMTIIYRFVPPPITWTMIGDIIDGRGVTKDWMSLGEIDNDMPRAAIAAEDARFCAHSGFDWKAMAGAAARNARGGRIRGGSTISQQTAKNVFLWEGRSYLRKGLEAYFTVLIEAGWGKRRIMEVYLNSIEWGPGIYGAEAAAQRIFKKPARNLTVTQAARLAAILPSPLKWKAGKPGPYVARRSRRIGAATGTVRRDGLDGCV